MDNNQESLEKLKELGYVTAKGLASIIPGAGGLISEWLSLAVASPMAKRREEWFKNIGEKIKKLEEADERFKPENLAKNEIFTTAILHATHLALRNNQEEKLEALKNGVINTVTSDIEEDKKLMFFNIIDSLTPTHLKILRYFNDPVSWYNSTGAILPNFIMAGQSSILESAIPELKGKKEFYDQVMKDLHARGLTTTSNLHTATISPDSFHAITTQLGKDFLSFIKDA